jgi:hypothetical protein
VKLTEAMQLFENRLPEWIEPRTPLGFGRRIKCFDRVADDKLIYVNNLHFQCRKWNVL